MAIITWAIAFLGFSLAGWRSGAIPKWIASLSALAAAAGAVSAMLIGTTMTAGGWPTMLFDIATFLSLGWFVSAGVWMLINGSASPPPRPSSDGGGAELVALGPGERVV